MSAKQKETRGQREAYANAYHTVTFPVIVDRAYHKGPPLPVISVPSRKGEAEKMTAATSSGLADLTLGQQILDESGHRTYIISTRGMTSGELLKYRNRLLLPKPAAATGTEVWSDSTLHW